MSFVVRIIATLAVLPTLACVSVYTEEDLPAEEARMDADARSEEVIDSEIGAVGGENLEAVREEDERVAAEDEF